MEKLLSVQIKEMDYEEFDYYRDDITAKIVKLEELKAIAHDCFRYFEGLGVEAPAKLASMLHDKLFEIDGCDKSSYSKEEQC